MLFSGLNRYYEKKEFETKIKINRPGIISEELKEALGIPPGAPPPWLIMMQKWGPPPHYPGLKICGLNCPLPPGAQWGFHHNGWGKPPVDETGKPLYGDIFGQFDPQMLLSTTSDIDRTLWGELEVSIDLAEPDVEAADQDDDQAMNEVAVDQLIDDALKQSSQMDIAEGIATPSGFQSVASTSGGTFTPATIELRKNVPGK